MNSLISVVIPVYNVEEYLDRCVNSILEQTYENLEVILVDDGSTDDSGSKCDYYLNKDFRIKVFHKSNGGLSDARNFGIQKATGEYIMFCDSDDFYDLDMIEYLFNLLTKYGSDISTCLYKVQYDDCKKVRRWFKDGEDELSAEECIEKWLYDDYVSVSACTKLYKKQIFDEVKFPVGRCFEDLGTMYKLFSKCNSIACGYDDKYNYCIRDNSITTQKFNLKRLDMIDLVEEMATYVSVRYPRLGSGIMRHRLLIRFSVLNSMINVGYSGSDKERIIDFIKKNRRFVLWNKKAPRRDKLAIILTYLGFYLYDKCIKLYCYVRHR